MDVDIRTVRGRLDLARHHNESTSRDDELTFDQVRIGLEGLVTHLGAHDWMVFQFGGFRVPTGRKSSMLLGSGAAAALGLELVRLSRSEGFEHLVSGFRNPTQFADSMFEVRMAAWCQIRPIVRRIRFGRRYLVRNRVKHPDFEILTPFGWVVCECKRLHVNSLDLSAGMSRLADAFDRELQAAGVGRDVRLQVEVAGPIRQDLETLVARACSLVPNMIDGVAFESAPFVLTKGRVGTPPYSQAGRYLKQGRIIVGTEPTGIIEEYMHLIVSDPRKERALLRASGALMNAALKQLPSNRDCVMFIEGPAQFGQVAAGARLPLPEYAHCMAIAVVGSDQVLSCRRDVDKSSVEWLFGDHVPSGIERLRQVVLRRSGIHRRRLVRLLGATAPQ